MVDIRKPARKSPAKKPAAKPSWSVAEAKARFSEVIARAQSGQPQLITRNGRKAVVVVSAQAWENAVKPKGTLLEFLMNSPLRGSNLDLERDKNPLRDIDL